MPLLFSYGTLQQDDIQLATYRRRLDGHRDALVGFQPAVVKIEDSNRLPGSATPTTTT